MLAKKNMLYQTMIQELEICTILFWHIKKHILFNVIYYLEPKNN